MSCSPVPRRRSLARSPDPRRPLRRARPAAPRRRRRVRPIGPAVSCVIEIGMMPRRLTSPTVGFRPTRPLTAAGQMMLPSVSVPTPTVARLAAIAAPVPALEPHGLRSSTYGIARLSAAAAPAGRRARRAEVRPFAQVRFAEHDAPASRSRVDEKRVLSRAIVGERERTGRIHHADDVDVVLQQHRDAVQRTARVCRPRVRRRVDRRPASASGFNSITEFNVGPCRSIAWMRSRYACVNCRAM